MFEDEGDGMVVTAEQYGVVKSWLLVQPVPAKEDLTMYDE